MHLAGRDLTEEDCDIRTWYRLWGKRLSRTTPGMLISALEVECKAAGGRLVRASTWSTALSQHCPCGERVSRSLRDREHKCIACGLVGKRDLSPRPNSWATPSFASRLPGIRPEHPGPCRWLSRGRAPCRG